MRDEQLADNLRKRFIGNWKQRSGWNRLQMLLFLLLDVVLILTLIFFESNGLVLFFAVVVGFIFFYMAVIRFPFSVRQGWKLLLPMAVGYIVMSIFNNGLLATLIGYAYMEFSAMTLGLALRWAVPMVREMHLAGWSRIGIIIRLFFAHFGVVVWLVYAMAVQVIAFQFAIGEMEGITIGVIAVVAWIAGQVPLVSTRYDLAKKYDYLL